MEGTAVHEASTVGIRPDWILVKGISDWGHDRTDRMRAPAVANAVEFVFHVVASRSMSRPRADLDA